jgi:hypothetical protein
VSDIKISQMEPWVGAVTGNVEFPAVFGNENYRIALSQLTTSTFGFGSMALQNSNAVSITGGNIAVTALSGAITIANGGTGLGSAPGVGQLLIGTGTDYSLSTLTAGTGVTISNSPGAITISATGIGSVTSVDVDGGSTGLVFSGGPITSAGTITMSGTLAIANGGTGATTASGVRIAIQAAQSGANSDITSLSGLTTPLSTAQGGTGAAGSLSGYIVGNGNSPYTSVLTIPMSDLAGVLPVSKGGTNATTVPDARVSLLPSYSGNAGKALALNTGGTDVEWVPLSAGGTVTSVNASGGTTGLSFSGGPIVAAGTLTLNGTLGPVHGGTGITSYGVGDLLFANTTTTLDKLPVGASTFLLASNGTAPAYVDPATVTVGNATNAVTATTATTATSATSATTATNIAGGAAGSVPYQSGAGATTFLAAGTGVLVNAGGNPSYSMTPSLTQVTVAGNPSAALEVATKQYVDTLIASGIHFHQPVRVEAPLNLNATYNNGTAGVGATLTNAGTQLALVIDGVTVSVADRVLVYEQTNPVQNGIYVVTDVGSVSTNWILTRSSDADTYVINSANGLSEGSTVFVQQGTTGAGETYTCNTSGVITFGTTGITFAQISATQIYSAGTGLTLTGTTFSLTSPVATTLGGTGLTSFTSGGAVYATSTSALTTGTLPTASGGTGQTSYTNGQLLIGKTDGTLAKASLTAGTGISVTGGDGTVTVTNSAPDQTVVLTPGSGISISGTYPSFTISASGGGTVTSVDVSGGTTGLTFSGGPVTAAGTITMAGTLAIANGGTNGTNAPTAGGVAFGTGTAYNFTSAGTAGQVLVSNGASAPAFGGIDGGTF